MVILYLDKVNPGAKKALKKLWEKILRALLE